jgi:hypothetical protein
MKLTKQDLLYYFALAFAVWFAITSAAWSYGAALVIAYPFGIASLILWLIGRKKDDGKTRFSLIPKILLIGLVISLIVMALLK